jgi:hypothetical protein
MKAILQTIKWTERPKLSRDAIFLIAIIAAGAITFFKLRPYFVRSSTVTVSATSRDSKPNGLSLLLKQLSIGDPSAPNQNLKMKGARGLGDPNAAMPPIATLLPLSSAHSSTV